MIVGRLLIYDASKVPPADPGFWYPAGVALFRKHFDAVVGVTSVEGLYAALRKHRPREVHVWSHGRPGQPCIGLKSISPRDPSWVGVGRVWFRACSVAQGLAGIAFCEALASQGVDVAAHLATIGPAGHGWLVGVRAGGRAWWSPEEKPKATPWGGPPWAPRCVGVTCQRLPAWAFDP